MGTTNGHNTPVRRTPARRGSGEALRGEIIEAASALLADSGDVETMSLRAVARAVGVATTSIYLHFDDIGELILAVNVKRFAELAARLNESLAEAGDDPVERVRAIGHSYIAFGVDNPGHYRVMFSASAKAATAAQGGLAAGLNAFQVLAVEVAGVLGLSPADRETHTVATALWTFVHGIVHLRTARPGFPWPDMNDLIDIMVDRMLPSPERLHRGSTRPHQENER